MRFFISFSINYCKFLVYFCDPYSSWQKGMVENVNKMVRKYLPKGYRVASRKNPHESIVIASRKNPHERVYNFLVFFERRLSYISISILN